MAAGVLPLLVHYVSEDFPLSAEVALQETLRGLLLESGLDGAAAFFHSKVDQGLGLKGRGDGKGGGSADLQGVVVGALTREELEGLLTKAGEGGWGDGGDGRVGLEVGVSKGL